MAPWRSRAEKRRRTRSARAAVRSYRGGGGARGSVAGAGPVRRGQVAGAAGSFKRSGNGVGERELEEEDGVWEKEEAKALPRGLYGRRGRGVGCVCDRVARCGLAHRKTNRRIGARNPGTGGEACDVGVEASSYVKSRVGRGSRPIDRIPGESEVTGGM